MRQISRINVVRTTIGGPGVGFVIEDGVLVIVIDERLTDEETDVIVHDFLARLGVGATTTTE